MGAGLRTTSKVVGRPPDPKASCAALLSRLGQARLRGGPRRATAPAYPTEVLKLCALAGLARVGTIALDGTKIKANASRHKAMSYDRMKEEETRLKEEIARLLAEAEASDADEDAAHGPDRSGEELPEELARRQDRL